MCPIFPRAVQPFLSTHQEVWLQSYRAGYRSSRNRRSNNKLFTIFFLVCLFLLILWDVAGPYGVWKLHKIRDQRKALYAQVVQADKENTILRKRLEAFQKDKNLQEQIVRQRLGWVKKNEVLYKFVD